MGARRARSRRRVRRDGRARGVADALAGGGRRVRGRRLRDRRRSASPRSDRGPTRRSPGCRRPRPCSTRAATTRRAASSAAPSRSIAPLTRPPICARPTRWPERPHQESPQRWTRREDDRRRQRMGTDWTGSRGEDPGDGCSADRPYGPRPYGPRPYGPRPYGPRPYGPRPYGPRSDTPRPAPMPYGPRSDRPPPVPTPYGPRPYGPRPYGPRGDDEDGAPLHRSRRVERRHRRAVLPGLGRDPAGCARRAATAASASCPPSPWRGRPGTRPDRRRRFRGPRRATRSDWHADPRKIELRRPQGARGAGQARAQAQAARARGEGRHPRRARAPPRRLAGDRVGLKQDIAHGLAVEADRAFLQGDPDGLAPVGHHVGPWRSHRILPRRRRTSCQVVRDHGRRDPSPRAGAIRQRRMDPPPLRVDALTRLLTADYQEHGLGTRASTRRPGAARARRPRRRGPPRVPVRRHRAATGDRDGRTASDDVT